MTIIFDSEGGFQEVPDPPKIIRKYSSLSVIKGPSLAEIIEALKSYPRKKMIFEIDPSSLSKNLQLISTVHCEVFIYGLRHLLMPTTELEFTMDKVENEWIIDAFVQTSTGFKTITMGYNVKNRNGSITYSWDEYEVK